MKKILLLSFATLSAVSALQAQYVITDIVDVEAVGEWEQVTGGSMVATTGGLTPQAGNYFWVGQTSLSGLRGASNYFDQDVIAGTYTVTFSIGSQDTFAYQEPTVLLLADTDDSGTYNWNDRILVGIVSSVTPTPGDGEWVTWTITYSIDESTVNAGGASVVGHEVGLLIFATLDNSGYAFDNLTITAAVPEPETNAALLGACAILGVCALRLRQRKAK